MTREKLQIEEDRLNPNRVQFTVGADNWPFPLPVIRVDGRWQLDAAAGRLEVLARRIGRNELNAMELCRGYAEAQLEYANSAHDEDHFLQYAQKVASSPGKRDGLYSGLSQSGALTNELVSKGFAEATLAERTNRRQLLVPYHGYYFRILKAQGPAAAGGAFGYVVNRRMIGGFALLAWPAVYGISGIRTLLINHEGVVYEKDLGAATAIGVGQILSFNPDKSWRRVTAESLTGSTF